MEVSDLKNFSKNKVPSEKSFGLTIAIAIFIYSIVIKSEFIIIYFFISLLLVLMSILFPQLLRLPNKLWIKLGEVLGKVITPLVMGIVFFLLITPFGFLLRILGKLQFQYRFKQNTDSFWIQRKGEEFIADQFNQQF